MIGALSSCPGKLHGSLHTGKIFLIPSNRLVSHKKRHKARKETTSFIPNGGVTVQGEGRKDYCTEWSFSPAIELPALHESIIILPSNWTPLQWQHLKLRSDQIQP